MTKHGPRLHRFPQGSAFFIIRANRLTTTAVMHDPKSPDRHVATSPNPFVVRPFAPADHDAVIAVWQSCGLVRPWNDPAADIAAKLKVDPGLFLVAERDREIVGTVMGGYDGHRGWVYLLGVTPERQSDGIGRRLIDEMETLLKARGCVKVNVQVRSSNEKVIAFYERLGYTRDACVGLGKRFDGKERGNW